MTEQQRTVVTRTSATALSGRARPLLFLVLVSLLALPFGVAGLLTDGSAFVLQLPVSVLLIIVPAATATVLAVTDGGSAGARRLWQTLRDVRSSAVAWTAVLAIPPSVLVVYLGVGSALGLEHTEPMTPLSLLPGLLLVYLAGAVLEEVGWTGYATDPLVDRVGMVGASLVIGVVWASVHWLPWAVMGHGASHIIAMTASTLILRLLITWAYVRGGGCLPLAVVLHAGSNAAQTYPSGLAESDPWVWLLAMGVVCAVVTTIGFVVRAFRTPAAVIPQ